MGFVKDMWNDGWLARGIMAFVALVVISMPFIVVAAVQAHNEWVDWCKNQGGHVVDHTTNSTGTGVDANGKPVVTTTSDTTYYCLNENGGIIDIQ